jgi:hypothetical protein
MHVELFEDSKSGFAHVEFGAWRARFPTGYFRNRRALHDYMLHTSTCGHLDPSIEDAATKVRKVCAGTEAELREWAQSEGHEITACSDCCR